MSKKKKLITESTINDTDYIWGESLDAAFFAALMERLSSPLQAWPAFKMGLINNSGKILRNPITKEERRGLSYLDRIALLMRQSMGGRISIIYNMYRNARLRPSFVQASARARSFRFLKYYDLRSGFFEKMTPSPMIGGVGIPSSAPGKDLG